MEFQRWWVIKSKIFCQESTNSKVKKSFEECQLVKKLVIILENQLIKEDLQKFASTSFFCSVLFSIAFFLQKNLAVILKIAINETKNIRKKYIRLFCRSSLVWCKVVHSIVPRDSYPRSLQLVYIWAYPRGNYLNLAFPHDPHPANYHNFCTSPLCPRPRDLLMEYYFSRYRFFLTIGIGIGRRF